jgi:hypothetical protein
VLARVIGIGVETADMLVNEILSRQLRDRKAVARYDHPAHQIALQEMVEAVRVSKERAEGLERVIEEIVPA